MTDYLLPSLGLLCMALQPIVAPLLTASAAVLFSCALQLAGFRWETLTADDDDAAMRAAMQRLSQTAWSMTRRAEAGKSPPGPGLFFSRAHRVVGWLSATEGRERGLVMTLLCTDAARRALTAPDAEDDAAATTAPPSELEGKDVACYSSFYGGMHFVDQKLAEPPLRIPAQERIANIVVAEIDVGLCILICGPPGTGKSAVAALAASMLSKAGREPTIVRGYSPLSNAGSLYRILDSYRPCRKAPLILCLDEFDLMAEKALSGRQTALPEKRAAPEITDKATLCGYLDRIAQRKHFALIATCNSDIAWWKDPARSFIVRKGRFAHLETLGRPSLGDISSAIAHSAAHYGIAENDELQYDNLMAVIGSQVTLTVGDVADALKRSRGNAQRALRALTTRV